MFIITSIQSPKFVGAQLNVRMSMYEYVRTRTVFDDIIYPKYDCFKQCESSMRAYVRNIQRNTIYSASQSLMNLTKFNYETNIV